MKTKKQLLINVILLLTGIIFTYAGQDEKEGLSVIPKPAKTESGEGYFRITGETKIVVASESGEIMAGAENLAAKLRRSGGFKMSVLKSDKALSPVNSIILSDKTGGWDPGKEGYRLVVNDSSVIIVSGTAAGLFYGIQTLCQMLPAEVEGASFASGVEWKIPCVNIQDAPRFPWRGMHLDVGRHFMPKEFVKKYIDLMSMYKMNTFHWHLTEDQGWRIEIKKYPKLTEVGSWRKETMGDSTRCGGFYTQDDIREVIEYARQRFVTVVPEIEMPGHCLAALSAYPELSCTGGSFEVGTVWGVFDDVYCPGKEKTFEFLEDVLTEVISLFPGEVIHIGGDECPKARWKECSFCRRRIKSEGLKNEQELQSYFIRRIEKFLNSRGKRVIGWDEILEGGLAPNAGVMSWRGTEGGIAAAKQGHDVVMTPGSHCYFDFYQGKYGEPRAIGGYLPIDTVYSYEPVPEELTLAEAKHVLGAQGNMWTEWMPNPDHVQYMLMPRMCALSEVVWCAKGGRDFRGFSRRLAKHYERLELKGVNFRVPPPESFGGMVITFRDTIVSLRKSLANSEIRFTTDGSDPTGESSLYSEPISIRGSQIITARTVLKGGKMSVPISTVFSQVVQRLNGMRYKYYKGKWKKLPNFDRLKPASGSRVYNIGLEGIVHRGEYFGVRFSGYIRLAKGGQYTFYTTSDDGSKLLIDNRVVVNNDGLHGPLEESGKVSLEAGKHKITVLYFQREGGRYLDASYEGPQVKKQPIPPALLFFR